MRPAALAAVGFASLSVVTLLLGVFGVLDRAPGVWPEAWPTAVVLHAMLALSIGYYVAKTGGLRS